uniref:Uncharacterized protein n=1 Tax=Plectus sambesii TaxID=2011161 RepID=A0A914WYW8_9BILA
MAAYPDYATYRDAGVYGTYPRKSMQNGDVSPLANGGAMPPRLAVNGNGHVASENGTIRGILRNKYDVGGAIRPSTIITSQDVDGSENGSDAASEHICPTSQRLRRVFKNCSSIVDRYMRPSVAELVSVTFSVFIVTMIESELSDRSVDTLPRITIISAVEGVCMLVFLLTFRRVHMNPAITLSQLFSASTSWRLCLIFLAMQLMGSIGGIFLYQAVKTEGPPAVAMIPYETATDWVRGAYRLVLCQTIAAFMVVLSHLIITGKRKKGDFAEVVGNPVGVIAAVMLMSFISLLHSTASWNPIRTLAASVAATVD